MGLAARGAQGAGGGRVAAVAYHCAMLLLTRTVRFCVGEAPEEAATPRSNTFAAWPSMRGLGRYYEIDVACAGEADPRTGYFLNIRAIDEAVRRAALPLIAQAVRHRPGDEPWTLMAPLLAAVNERLGGSIRRLTWRLTPFYSVSMETKPMPRCLVRQHFEFAASHRLHCPDLTAEENRRLFGKCNSERGHGHNYRVEVAVEMDPREPRGFNLPALEAIVGRTLIERFDHKYLNEDCTEFAGVNPSVENIARVSYDLLRGELADAGLDLRHVTVWETEKTSCTYPVP